jgi:hypothetical protein
MTISASPSVPMSSGNSITTAVIRRADRYVEMLEQVRIEDSLRTKEADLLDKFERYTADVLDRYWQAWPRNRESLAFASLYEPQAAGSVHDRDRALITALMAADVESRGPFRLTQAQNNRLAAVFERIGKECQLKKLFRHAALAFDSAADIYLLLGKDGVRDRCLFARKQCIRKAMKPSWVKVRTTIAWVSCGYGYQPYRLMLWMAVQIAVFSILFDLTGPESIWSSIYMCLVNYLDPLDTEKLSTMAKAVLVTESYVGLVSLSVFFALLVRRWFRT